MDRIMVQERRAEIVRELNDYDGIEPLDVDVEEVFKHRELINRFYVFEEPTFTPPRVFTIPPSAEKRVMKTPFNTFIKVYSLNGGEELIIDGVRYRKLKTINAAEEPIIDTFYLMRFVDGIWNYYVPAGDEFEKYYSPEQFVTGTHYLVNFDDGMIVDYPMGSIASSDDDLSIPRVQRTMVLASKIFPRSFESIGTSFLKGDLNEKALEEVRERLLELARERSRVIMRVYVVEDP